MTNDASDLWPYLPKTYRSSSESEYIGFLWQAYESNYEEGRFEFASLAFHLLYMSFVSFSVWQIRQAKEEEFSHALIGFQSEAENKILKATSPFAFYEKLKESQIFRFLKIIGCTNEQIGEFAKFVRRRNKIAHPTGSVFFNDQTALDDEIELILEEVRNIQDHMKPIIRTLYEAFLLDSADPEEREYGNPDEQVEFAFIHRFYLSPMDIQSCSDFDLSEFDTHPLKSEIEELHESIDQSLYA